MRIHFIYFKLLLNSKFKYFYSITIYFLLIFFSGIFLLKASGLLSIITAIVLYTLQPYEAIFKWVSAQI